jgi:hypothetical protein
MHIEYFLTGLMGSVLSAFTSFLMPALEFFEKLDKHIDFVLKWNDYFIIGGITFLVIVIGYFYYQSKRNKKIPAKHKRFEKIKEDCKNLKMNFGYTEYRPYSYTDGNNITGIGPKILTEIFSIFKYTDYDNFKYVDKFEDLLTGLRHKNGDGKYDYDIIATPLYETRTRIFHDSNLAFCIPLFYAEIGLYMSSNGSLSDLSYTDFQEKNLEDFKFAYMKDELSEMIKNKFKNKNKGYMPANTEGMLGFTSMLREVADAHKDSCNIVAMEVFKADELINDCCSSTSPNLTNILKSQQLLYPVSFVVRKEDTALRHFLNLRIMEMIYDNKSNKLFKIFSESINTTDIKISDIFIHEYKNWDEL